MAANADVAALAGVTALEPATASVLIVDDDPVQRLALRAALAPLGHPTVEVESGAEALRQVKCQRFAVILMDVRMPGMDGYEAAALIRAQLSGDPTPIIFITAAPRDETEALSGYRLGAVDFVFAPIVPEELRAKVSVFAELFITSQRLKRAGRHFELSSDLTCTVGFDGYMRQLNEAWELALGWSEAELRSRPFVELIHPDDRELSTREASKLAAGATTASFLSRHLTKDGGWRWLEWNAVAAPDDHLFFGSARDVSERIDADEAVTRLASIVESFDDAVIGIAPDGTVVSWNAAAEQVLGHSPEEAVGRPIGALMLAPPERGEEVARNLARIKSGGRVQRVETVRIHKHGHPIDVALTISPTWDSSGELSGASATIRDISDQKRTRRYLDAQHEATRVLAEAATVAEALPRLLQVIGERMEWPVCAVWMPASEAPESGLLCAAFWHEPSLDLDLGRFETLTRGLTLSRDEGLPGRVWSSRCPRWITDVSAEPQSARAADALAHGLHACVLLPIISGENAVAMIELRSLEARPLDPALLDMFDRLSGQVGLFLERKRGEAALEVSERQNRQIIESAHDAFVSMDEAGRVTGWNSRAQATFGWSAGEAIGQLLAELIIPPALREAHRVGMARFLATGEGQLLDTPLELTGL
ncbi:MAG TPA: PAS domain S-box protein, partial [Thermoleophilaceae bacterium]|nr:PAS domain S-box protein [Thermoleophilaceae bacterium]